MFTRLSPLVYRFDVQGLLAVYIALFSFIKSDDEPGW